MFGFGPEQITQKVQQEAVNAGKGLFGGLLGSLVNGPMGLVKGALGGAWNWGLYGALPIVGVALLIPQAALWILEPLSKVTGKDFVSAYQQMGDREDGSKSVIKRALTLLGIVAGTGAAVGGASGAVQGVMNSFSPAKDGQSNGNNIGAIVGTAGLGIVVLSVVAAAVKNGNIKLPDLDGKPDSGPAATPPTRPAIGSVKG